MPALHVIPGIWTPVEGYAGLVRFLRKPRFELVEDRPNAPDTPPGNLVLFAYDWRLSNRWNATLLKERVERSLDRWRNSAPQRKAAKVVFVCHSMGGLVARWYLERQGGAEIARALVTLGTPHRGALTALANLVNGVTKGIGPLKLDLTQFARSLPSSYQLLPEYACIQAAGDDLLKTTELTLPQLDQDRVRAGAEFHRELNEATPFPSLPVVGIGQPTPTTARIVDDGIEPLNTIDEEDLMGDGTVPRLAAKPLRMSERDSAIRGVADGHGLLPGNRSVLDQLDFQLTVSDVVYRAVARSSEASLGHSLGITAPDLHEAGEPVRIAVLSAERRVIRVVAMNEANEKTASGLARFDDSADGGGRFADEVVLDNLPKGGYVIVAEAPGDPAGIEIPPVRTTTLIW